jgi:outer membrane protein
MVGLLAAVATVTVGLPARADALKIGYFDVKQILAEADQAGEIKKRLQEDFKKKQDQLDKKKTEIDQLQQDYEAKKAVLSPSALTQMQNDLQTKVQDAQKLYMELQQDLQSKEQQAIGELLSKLQPVVQTIAQEEGYTYVFEKNEAGLFYGPAQDDLTAQLLRKLNALYHSGGGGAKTKGKSK